jgi:LPXTG-motif cell wall-anchored protein
MSLRRILHLTVSLVIGVLVVSAVPAGATENPDYTAPPPTTVVTSPAPTSEVQTAVKVTPVRTRLAITGSDATGMVAVGVSLITLGTGVLIVRRRKAALL